MVRPKRHPRLVFVIGSPRSGTTFIINALVVNQDKVAGTPRESMIFTWGNQQIESVDRLTRKKYFTGYLGTDFLTKIREGETYLEFWERSIHHTLAVQNASYFAEKSPVHTLYWKTILTRFEGQAKFVLVERHPAATIHSMVNTGWIMLTSDKLPFGLNRILWLRYYSALLTFCRYEKAIKAIKASRASLLTLHYEQIITGSCDLKAELENFLGLPLNPLYEVKPFSSTKGNTDEAYVRDQSKINAYKAKMPKHWQRVVRNIFHPKSSGQRIKGSLFRIFLILPFLMLKSSGK